MLCDVCVNDGVIKGNRTATVIVILFDHFRKYKLYQLVRYLEERMFT